jgi:hypothetical protein
MRIALVLVALGTAGGVTATIAHGDDPPATATFTTVDGPNLFHLMTGTGSATSADIVTGGTVTFQNSSVEEHNVDFQPPAGGGVSCQQTVGGPSPNALRFPNAPTDGTWSGVCTFSKAGTYSFACDMHPGMTGTVVVSDAGTTTATTTTPTTTTTTPTTTTPVATTTPVTTTPVQPGAQTPSGTPAAALPDQTPAKTVKALSFKISVAQRGPRVRGTINGARSAGRVKLALTARRTDLGLEGKQSAPVAVGALSGLATATGSLAFSVPLNAKGKAALAKRGHLTLTLRVTAPSSSGVAVAKTYKVTLRST